MLLITAQRKLNVGKRFSVVTVNQWFLTVSQEKCQGAFLSPSDTQTTTTTILTNDITADEGSHTNIFE